ncbi:MAG: hypothetical protein LBT82_02005, partial [Oscillospiraceae bacterium]|nr:hypothetical protein [Oscillospiraceae bacterium]
MSKKNLSFKNLKVKKNIAVIMSMTMSLNCVVAHAGPVKHKRGKNHNKNQQTTSVSDTKHQSPPPAVEKTPTQTEKPKEQPSNQPITKETQTEKKSNFQTASKTQQNQQTNKPDKETQIMAKTQTNEPTKFQFYEYPYFQNKKQQQKMEEITFHNGKTTEILPNFEIPNGQNKKELMICYDAKTPINKDTNHNAIPVTIKIIDGKPNGLFFNETDQDYLNPTIKSEDFDFFMKAYETIKTMQQLNEIC